MEERASSKTVARNTKYQHAEMKIDTCLHPVHVSTQSKLKTLRPETLKVVQERAGNTLEAIGTGNYFLNRTQMAHQLRERIDKWNYMKLKDFCTTKEMVPKLKRPSTKWEKIFAGYM
jgi:hypothetical protein